MAWLVIGHEESMMSIESFIGSPAIVCSLRNAAIIIESHFLRLSFSFQEVTKSLLTSVFHESTWLLPQGQQQVTLLAMKVQTFGSSARGLAGYLP